KELTSWPNWYFGLESFAWPSSAKTHDSGDSGLPGVLDCPNGVYNSEKYFECEHGNQTRGMLVPIEHFTRIVDVWEIVRKLVTQKIINEQMSNKLGQVSTGFAAICQCTQELQASFVENLLKIQDENEFWKQKMLLEISELSSILEKAKGDIREYYQTNQQLQQQVLNVHTENQTLRAKVLQTEQMLEHLSQFQFAQPNTLVSAIPTIP
ncbi:hypothetical protein RFI_14628, partial [Reticulomyxa filosa]